MHGHPVDGEALLAHGEFVRALARKLVFDADRVDDVVQETWLAALEHAPERPRSLRAWLARVVRNVAIKALRTESRRRRREEGTPEARPPEPPPDAVDRLARGRQVVDAVLALDEPYRTTVVLRFYEDLEPNEIARRLGTNSATVRTRLKRGLDMLRARLDKDTGDRRAWCLALLPVLVPKTSVTGGILLMSAKTKISIAAVFLLAAALGLLATWGARGSGPAAERASPRASATPAADSEGASGAVEAAEQAPGTFRVVVRVEDDAGTPLPGTRVEAHASWFLEFGRSYGGEDFFFADAVPSRPLATATTDATGVAVFHEKPRLAFVYRATKEGYARADSDRVELRGGADPDPVTLRLGPAFPLTGFVRDEDGSPVVGAPVLAAEPAYRATAPDHQIPLRTVTGEDGSYRFDDLPPREVAVWAAFPGGVPWRIATLRFPHVRRFDIVLERGGSVTGKVTDADTGVPIAGTRVRGTGYVQHRAEVYTDALGRYEISSLPATLLSSIRLKKEGYYQVFEGERDQIGVRVGRGDTMRVDLKMRRGPILRGTVRGPNGPLAGASFQASNWWKATGAMFETRTDEQGRFVLAVMPGRLVVNIGAKNLRISGALDEQTRPEQAKGDEGNIVDMPERGEVVRDFALELAPLVIEVRGRVVDRARAPIEAARVGFEDLSAADGTFRTEGWKGYPVWARKAGYTYGESEPVEPGRDAEIVLLPAPTVRGTVAARDGSAVENAFVLLAQQSESPDASREGRLWLDARRVAAVGGRYEIRDLAPGTYLLRAGARGLALSASSTVVAEAAAEHTLDFVLDAGDSLKGRVVDATTGAGVRGAWVHANPLEGSQRARDPRIGPAEGDVVVAVSADDGAFAVEGLARGEYEILAEARGFLRRVARGGTGTVPVVVRLEPALEIRGVVTFADGRPAPGLAVFAHRDGDARDRSYAPPTDPRGAFVVPALKAGTYRVVAGGGGARSVTSEPVAAGTEDLRLVVEKAGPGQADEYPEAHEGDATLEGRVVDPSGNGIAGVKIYASPTKEKPSLLGRSTRSGPDGRFAVRGVRAEAHRVRAVFEGGGLWQMKEDVLPGRDAPEFVFASISGTIEGGDIAGRDLIARPRPFDEKAGSQQIALLGETFEVRGLPPGRYDLSFKAPKPGRPHLLLEGGDDIVAGRRDLVLRATKGASISGVLVDDAGRPMMGWVAAYREGTRDGASARTRADGRFEIAGLRAGAVYELSATAPGSVPGSMRVEAPATDLRVVIETGFAASGRLLDAGGQPVSSAALRFVAQGHEAPERRAQTDATGRFTVDGLRDGEYRVETWPVVVVDIDDAGWQLVGTIRARDKDVEFRLK